ncbi:UDP-glycosyltransferase TURAN isoform X3 [Phoenix dactylifera]|uniref:UDP-glycosyltransferase TURAN isoform X3 n=1 Tax=Phoenix dactylifera TaxID=42345 RepID=A0A8B7MUV5_PHODC|nr:UDP-glycosyltransferase TURAN isoform X3 [Phoenix dactylifera]
MEPPTGERLAARTLPHPHLTPSTVAGRRPYRSLSPWLQASPLSLTSRSDGSMEKRGRVAVVVLGDIGRSPRMQYHALSLAQQAHLEVDIVANGGSDPHMAVKENQSIHLHIMTSVNLQGLSKISSPLALLLKAAVHFIILVWFLCLKIPRPDVFVVQNPPSVPTLAAVKLSSWLRRSTFIIDWHNFGYTLLGLSHGRGHIIVKIYHWFEKYFGRMADGSLCVTKAMQHELAQNWGIKATVLYDEPPEFFHPASLEEKHELFSRLENNICHPNGIRDCVTTGNISQRGPESGAAIHWLDQSSDTLFSTQIGNEIFLKASRPALVVSSTSWTPDEDFGILLEAAVMYDRRVAAALNEDDSVEEEKIWTDISNGKQYLYPRLLFIITGKGPERRKYEEQIKKLNLRRVAFRTMWLLAEDYPLLLGSADLGVSLHTSSSGLDLPMKVVDMFGCGLPVCAVSFSCITELVEVEKNGLLFSTSSELADEFMMLFKGFPERCDTLNSLRDGALATASSARWSTEWETHALPLISELISGKQR